MAKQIDLPSEAYMKIDLPQEAYAPAPAPKFDLGQAYLSNPALNAIQNLIVPAANVVESALPIVGSQKPKYTTPDIESMRSDMENTNRMLEDVAKRRDMDDQTKNTIFQRLENRRKEQYKNFVQASGESLPYEPFTEYLAKRGIPVAVMDILMAPQRISTAVGQGIVAGAGGLKDVITGKGEGFNKRYQDLAKERPEVLYMNPSQLLNMANKYGEGENLLKPGESWQDMLRREREATNAMEAEQGSFAPLLEKSYMGKDYKTIETPEMIKTTAGVTGFVLDAILDPSNLLPGIGVGVSTGKAISRSVLRRGISGATDLDELIKAAQKASVNGMSRKEIETLFKSRASKIAPKLEEIMMETPQQQVRVDLAKEPLPLKPEEIIAGEALPPTRVTLTKEQLPVTPETPVGEAGMAGVGATPNVPIKPSFVPEPSTYPLNPEDFRRYQEDLMFSEDEALRARIEEAIFGKQPSKSVVEGVPTEPVVPLVGEVGKPVPPVSKSSIIEGNKNGYFILPKKYVDFLRDEAIPHTVIGEDLKIEKIDINDDSLGRFYNLISSPEVGDEVAFVRKTGSNPYTGANIYENGEGVIVGKKDSMYGEILQIKSGDKDVYVQSINTNIIQKKDLGNLKEGKFIPIKEGQNISIESQVAPVVENVGQVPPEAPVPEIKPEIPAPVSVPEEQVGTITPTTPEKPPEAQISGQAGQGIEGLAKETPKIPIVNEQGFVEAHAGVNVVEPIKKLGMEYLKTATPADNLITRSPGFDKFITFLNNIFPNRGVGDAFLKALNLGQEKTYRNVRRGVFLAEQYAKQDIELMWDNLRDIAHDKAKKSVVDFMEPFEDIWSKGLPPEKAKAVVDLMEKTGEYTGLLRGVADEENITSKEFMILSNIVNRENREIEKNIAKSGAKSTITPTDPEYWKQKGYSPDDMAKINNMGILKESDYGVNNVPQMGYSLSKKGRNIALIIKTTKNPEKILKSRYNIPEDRIDLVKNIIDEMVRFDKPQVSFNPTRMKREIVRSEEVDNLVAKGMLEESLGKRVGKKFQPSYALTEKGRAVWDTVDKTPLNALAVFDSSEVYKKAVAQTGIKTEEEMMELARKFSNWYQQMIQEVPLSEGQIRKVKTMWNRYYPRERATLSIDGLKKIMYNPKYYTPEEVKMAENIYLSAKDSRKELQTITQQKAEMKDIFQKNITTADDPEAFKVPKKLLAKADLADDAEIYLTQEGKSLAVRKSIEMWAFNRAMRNRGGLLTPKRVGVTGIDTVNFMNRNLTADYDAVLPYIKNPVDVLETTMKRVANAVRTTEFFDEIKKIPEYVRTDLDPARVGERYVDPQTSLVYQYIKPEKTEYMNLAGTYINENVLHSIQTQQQGLSMGRYLISNAWDRFARPVWYSMMTVNRPGYHAMNILSSGVNMLLANPTLIVKPRSAWNTFTKWFKVLGSRAERMKYADDIRDLIEHEIIGAENLSSSGKSHLGTIPGVDAVVFDMPAILNKGGLTISEMLEKLPELANQSDALARIVYYEERKKELQGIMKKPEYKKLSAEEQEVFIKEFKANIADEAKTIVPSYIDTLPALKTFNEYMPLTSWGIKATKIPYRNLLTLLGKNDLKGFNALTKKINMTNKAKAALTLLGIPALAGINAYVQYANNPEEAMATAAAMPEWKNNFYDQGEGSINFLEKMAGNQENYLAMKYVLDAIANRSFTFNTGKGRITVYGAAYGEKYRIPSVVNPIFTVADAVRGVNVNAFSKTGEPISTSPDTLGQLRDTLAWMWVQSSPDMKRWQNEVRKLQKKKIPEKDARIMAAWKLVDPEAIFRYDKVERSDLEGKIKGLGYKITNKRKEYNKAVGNPEKQQQILEEVKALRSKQAGYTRLLPNLPVDDEIRGGRR